MLEQVQGALHTVAVHLARYPELGPALAARWAAVGGETAELPEEARAAADVLWDALPPLTRSEADLAILCELFDVPVGEALFLWCSASTWRSDVNLSWLLSAASEHDEYRDRVAGIVR